MSHKLFRRLINLFLTLAITLAGTSSASAADGSLDPTFGTGGKVTTDFGSNLDDYGSDVALQPDGKIIVAGQSYNDSNADFVRRVAWHVLDHAWEIEDRVVKRDKID